ncbi:hypothetical protein C8J56DRAFT_1053045 [Mycena floridula]|nr:hypothetical protein C8J56DRAFT_1053045 [Mycena floridula]
MSSYIKVKKRVKKSSSAPQNAPVIGNGVVNLSTQDLLSFTAPSVPIFQVDHLSADRRRIEHETHEALPPSPVKKKIRQETALEAELFFASANLDNADPLPFADWWWSEQESEDVNVDEDRKSKRYVSSDEPLKLWMAVRNSYLAELIALEGCRWKGEMCSHCPEGKAEPASFHCNDCFEMRPVCQTCCVYEHTQMPLHRVQRWNGVFFERVSLMDLGLRVQLGHGGNETCSAWKELVTRFTVIDMNGIHTIAVDFCQCYQGKTTGEEYQQLLRNEWFPATHLYPKTAATFRCIEQFHILTLTGKVMPFNYYTGLQRLTDNTGCKKVPGNNAVRPLLETKPGETVVECPACPRPNVNLPEGWEHAKGKQKFLYILFIAMDACFRLKRKIVSNDLKDPGLGTGWAYFLEDEPYRDYVATLGDQEEENTCTGLSAVDHANTRFSRGYAVTGVGLALCARHEFVGKNAAGDLQVGEKFGNMTMILASFLRHICLLLMILVSYDINCQFYKKFEKRVSELPEFLRFRVVMSLFKWVIPKLHILGHKAACQLLFNLNYMLGAARTDGEGVERPWANIGPVATSTREMGPGHHHDTLDDHWHDWNWRKVVGLGKLLARRLVDAEDELKVQKEAFVPVWREAVEKWEADSTQPNPYQQKKSTITLQKVRLELSREEAAMADAGMPGVYECSAAEFVLKAMDLEEQQRRVKREADDGAYKKSALFSTELGQFSISLTAGTMMEH